MWKEWCLGCGRELVSIDLTNGKEGCQSWLTLSKSPVDRLAIPEISLVD